MSEDIKRAPPTVWTPWGPLNTSKLSRREWRARAKARLERLRQRKHTGDTERALSSEIN